MRKLILLLAVTMVIATIVSTDAGSTRAAPPTQVDAVTTLDDLFAEIADSAPGFGGVFFDDEGTLTMYLVDPTQRSRAETAVRSALDREGVGRPERVRPGQYDFRQLKIWHDSMLSLLDIPGVVLTDIDEAENRLTVGVEDLALTEAVRAELTGLGIPQQAVEVQRTERPVPETGLNLQDKVATLAGGLQIAFHKPNTPKNFNNVCTLGFIALSKKADPPVPGFVTAAHCTSLKFNLNGTVIHQPIFQNKVGVEQIDPPTFDCPNSPPNTKQCRWSDSAFVNLNPDVNFALGKIKQPTNKNTTKIDGDKDKTILTIRKDDKDFVIVDSSDFSFMGQPVSKVGRTTGWTNGNVTRTCYTENMANPTANLLCQYRANYISASGDSGAPVFEILSDNQVRLKGIHWAGPTRTGQVIPQGDRIFSPLGGIRADLGPLNVIDPDSAVGGVAELPEVAGTPLETDGSSGASAGVLAGAIAGAVLVGGVSLGGAAWYARRRLSSR